MVTGQFYKIFACPTNADRITSVFATAPQSCCILACTLADKQLIYLGQPVCPHLITTLGTDIGAYTVLALRPPTIPKALWPRSILPPLEAAPSR